MQQIKLTGWTQENPPSRRFAVERWITASNAWYHYDHVKSLPRRGPAGLMPFSLLKAPGQDDRDELLKIMK
eukprot:5008595-Alexandrium_andersonii.AAC.1